MKSSKLFFSVMLTMAFSFGIQLSLNAGQGCLFTEAEGCVTCYSQSLNDGSCVGDSGGCTYQFCGPIVTPEN